VEGKARKIRDIPGPPALVGRAEGMGRVRKHDRALKQAVTDHVTDNTELYRQFFDNEAFRKWMSDAIFALTYRPAEKGFSGATG